MALLGLTEYLDLAPSAIYCLRILIALFCGVILGVERAIRSRGAGIRVHAIMAAGAALFMVVSKYAFTASSNGFDPTLIAALTIDGSGFLCAGVIFNTPKDDSISGMATASNLWATAAIGMACGCGLELLGVLFALLLLINHQFFAISGVFSTTARTIQMTIENKPHVSELLLQLQKEFGIRLVSSCCSRSAEEGTVHLELKVRSKKPIRLEDTIHFLDTHPEIKDVSI